MKTISTEAPVMAMSPVGTLLVGVIRSFADLLYAQRDPDAAQAYELRLDAIRGPEVISIVRRLKDIGKSIILTVRAPQEGGLEKSWDTAARIPLFLEHLDISTHVDIEAEYALKLRGVMDLAKSKGIKVIISSHYLDHCPSEMRMDWPLEIFRTLNGDIFKLAAMVNRRSEMARIDAFAERTMREFPGRIAPMAIGPKYGRSSRKRFAEKGAALVYCYLSEAIVEGQWQALEFKKEMGM